jgi:phosphatidylserine/phosphatidylglycerophosphate/cardiolipin synthase-like enzyme
MAKRRSSNSKTSPLRSLLYLLVLILVLGAIYAFDLQDELGIETTEEEPTPQAQTGNVQEPATTASDWYEVYFTEPVNSNDPATHRGSTLEAALVREIDSTQNTIDAALFELDIPSITDALVRALGRGVAVRIVFDDEHGLEAPDSTAQQVISAGAQSRSDERSALMHDKYFIFDGTTVWTGATNVTHNGIYNNNNNAILIRSQALAQNFQSDFDEMFVDGVFNRRDDSRPVPNRTITVADTEIETYFSPEDGDAIETRLVELTNAAQSSVHFMAFSFTLDSVGQALVQRMQNGVTVEGVFETTGSLQGQMPVLACAGANVVQDGNPSIMHHKVFIFDDQIVALGSFNFSASARDDNSENLIVVHNPAIAAAYMAEWQKVYSQGSKAEDSELDC